MNVRSLLRLLFSPWVLLGAVIVAGLLFGGMLLAVLALAPEGSPAAPTTPMVLVIPAPTITPVLPTATPSPTGTPTLPVPPGPPMGSIVINDLVQITGTGGDGLRLHTSPGLQSEVRFIGLEAEVFRVADGPQDVDGYTWYYLVAPFDETRRGWAVSNYLAETQSQ